MQELSPTHQPLISVSKFEFLKKNNTLRFKTRYQHPSPKCVMAASPVFFSVSSGSNSPAQVTPQSFLSFFYYGALVRIGTREYAKAIQLLLVALTCPATCLSAIQVRCFFKSRYVSGWVPSTSLGRYIFFLILTLGS